MQPETAREQPVAVRDVDDVVLVASRHHEGAGGAFRPIVDVAVGETDDGEFARRAAGRVHSRDLAYRQREAAEGIVRAKVRLGGERQLRDVLYALDILGLEACGVHLGAEIGRAFVGPLHHIHKTRGLQRSHLVAGHGLDLFVVISHISSRAL